MKKTVKALVIAASVAAVAGIGAVSFAAWEGGTKTNEVQNGGTGHVDTTGFGTGTMTTLSDKLMPYDQGSTTTGQTKYYDIKLVVEGNDVSNYKIQGYYTATKTSTDYSWENDSELVYLIDQNETATYTGSGWTSWTAATSSSASDADLVGGGTLTAGNWYVHVALDSEEAADMDVTLYFHFVLTAK